MYPIAGVKEPAGHGRHVAIAHSGWNSPGAQGRHALRLAAPLTGIRVPGGHGEGTMLPSSQKWPTEHAPVHVGVIESDLSP